MAGSTVQHRLKLIAAVASCVVIAPFWILCKLLTMLGKLPIKTVPALTPVLGSAVTFIRVANCTGSSFANTIAAASFVLFSGLFYVSNQQFRKCAGRDV